MDHHASCAFLVALVLPTTSHATNRDTEREFPAEIHVVEIEPKSPSSFSVRLTAERGVDIYANKPMNAAWNHVAARLEIHDADGKRVRARIRYPLGTKVDADPLGDLYVYRDSVDITVTIVDAAKHPLSYTLEGAGYNRTRSYCLGKMKLETVRK